MPYVVTVTGKNGGRLIKDIQDQIYRDWPFETAPPPPVPIDGFDEADAAPDEGGGQFLYTYQVPGQEPVNVRMFSSVKGLVAASRPKPPGEPRDPWIRSKKRAPGGGLTPSGAAAAAGVDDDLAADVMAAAEAAEATDVMAAGVDDDLAADVMAAAEVMAAGVDLPDGAEEFLRAVQDSIAHLEVEMGANPRADKRFTMQDIKLAAPRTVRDLAEIDIDTSETLLVNNCKVFLCVTTMGRDDQLKKALPLQLAVAWRHKEVAVHVVDFNQSDDLETWVHDNLRLALGVGKLSYHRCKALPNWHASLAKNTAHMAAVRGGLTPQDDDDENGDAVLVSLDGDNVITPTWLRKLLQADAGRLLRGEIKAAHYSNPSDPGTYGRIAYTKNLFVGVRGYDVGFLPMGCQDTDILKRLGSTGSILEVKHHHVGVSFLNYAPTGDAKQDRQANYQAPTRARSSHCASYMMVGMGSSHRHHHACHDSLPRAPGTPGKDCELRGCLQGHEEVDLHPDGPAEPRGDVQEPGRAEPRGGSGSQRQREVAPCRRGWWLDPRRPAEDESGCLGHADFPGTRWTSSSRRGRGVPPRLGCR